MGFERIIILGDRALAHGNGGRYQNGGQYQQAQEQRSKEEQGRGQDPDAESLRRKMLYVGHGAGEGGGWGPRAKIPLYALIGPRTSRRSKPQA